MDIVSRFILGWKYIMDNRSAKKRYGKKSRKSSSRSSSPLSINSRSDQENYSGSEPDINDVLAIDEMYKPKMARKSKKHRKLIKFRKSRNVGKFNIVGKSKRANKSKKGGKSKKSRK
jgi:hypothetical protein